MPFFSPPQKFYTKAYEHVSRPSNGNLAFASGAAFDLGAEAPLADASADHLHDLDITTRVGPEGWEMGDPLPSPRIGACSLVW